MSTECVLLQLYDKSLLFLVHQMADRVHPLSFFQGLIGFNQWIDANRTFSKRILLVHLGSDSCQWQHSLIDSPVYIEASYTKFCVPEVIYI